MECRYQCRLLRCSQVNVLVFTRVITQGRIGFGFLLVFLVDFLSLSLNFLQPLLVSNWVSEGGFFYLLYRNILRFSFILVILRFCQRVRG